MIEITKDILKKVYKKRPEETHKYDYGLVLVIGGSEFYSGAPALSALAAFRSGADMVRVLAPKRAADIIASFSPNLSAYPLKGNWLDGEDLSTVIEITKSSEIVSHGKTAVIIGNGMGRSEETKETILKYISEISIPIVIDADAIHAIAKKPEILAEKNCLVTPHSYEFFILTGKEIKNLPLEKRIKLIEESAKKLKTTILFKGKIDIISNGEKTALNRTGSPYLSKGGTGDTLAGICGGLMARGVDKFEAACAGAYINSKAGEIVAKKLKQGLLATDLVEAIPQVLV